MTRKQLIDIIDHCYQQPTLYLLIFQTDLDHFLLMPNMVDSIVNSKTSVVM